MLPLFISNSHFLYKYICRGKWELHMDGGNTREREREGERCPHFHITGLCSIDFLWDFKCVILYWKPSYSQRIMTLCKLYWWLVWSYFTNNENKEHKFTKVKSLFCDDLVTKIFMCNKSLYNMLWWRMKWCKKVM